MLCFDRIDVSEGIYVNNTSASKECDISHYWHFLNKGFKCKPNVGHRCHDFSMVPMNLSNFAISNFKSADNGYIISGISKNGTINLMQNIDLAEKSGALKT